MLDRTSSKCFRSILLIVVMSAASHAAYACDTKLADLKPLWTANAQLLKDYRDLTTTVSVQKNDERNTGYEVVTSAAAAYDQADRLSLLLEVRSKMVDARDIRTVDSIVQRDLPTALKQIDAHAEYVNKLIGYLRTPPVTMQAMRVRDRMTEISSLLHNCGR